MQFVTTMSSVLIRALLVLAVFLGLYSFLATEAYAAFPSQLVPCGNQITHTPVGDYIMYSGECDVCDLSKLGMNILNFLIAICVAVTALLFANAGYLYVTSSANPGNIARAHKMFTSTLIGLIAILAAYLLIDTVMKSLLGGEQLGEGRIGDYGPWNEILCIGDKDEYLIKKLDSIELEASQLVLPHATGPGWNPEADFTDGVTPTLTDAAFQRGLDNLSNNCTTNGMSCADYITQQALLMGVDPEYALALAIIESGGCSNPATCTSPAGAVGVIQLMPATARELCGAACAGYSDAQMATYLSVPANNIALGIEYMKESDAYVSNLIASAPTIYDAARKDDYMAAYYNGGATAIQPSEDCAGMVKYECTIDQGGYVETAKYVANMNNIVDSFTPDP